MSWIDYRNEKPETDVFALVTHERCWMSYIKATYDKKNDTWQCVDPSIGSTIFLHITHYIPIPIPPRI